MLHSSLKLVLFLENWRKWNLDSWKLTASPNTRLGVHFQYQKNIILTEPLVPAHHTIPHHTTFSILNWHFKLCNFTKKLGSLSRIEHWTCATDKMNKQREVKCKQYKYHTVQIGLCQTIAFSCVLFYYEAQELWLFKIVFHTNEGAWNWRL